MIDKNVEFVHPWTPSRNWKTPHSLLHVTCLNYDLGKKKINYDLRGFPGGTDSKESACSEEDPGSIPGSGRSPGEGNGSPLQYFCLEDPIDRGAWRATIHGITKSQTQLRD